MSPFRAVLRRFQLVLFVLALCGSVASCGGGGSSGASTPTPPAGGSGGPAPLTITSSTSPDAVETQTVALTASASGGTPPFGFAWQQDDGPSITIEDAGTANASFLAPDVTDATSFTFTVSATDAANRSASAAVTVEVLPNVAPVIDVFATRKFARLFGDVFSLRGRLDHDADLPGVQAREGGRVVLTVGDTQRTADVDANNVWRIDEIPLPPSDGTLLRLDIQGEDAFGATARSTFDLENRPTLDIRGIVVDPADENRFIALDDNDDRPRIVSIDITTGVVTILVDPPEESGGQDLDAVGDLYVDPTGNRLIFFDLAERQLESVDLATGARAVLSDADTGAGPAFGFVTELVVVPDRGQAFVFDSDATAVLQIDLGTGDRSVLSANGGPGSGPTIDQIDALAFDADTQSVLATQTNQVDLAINATTGDRLNLAPVFLSRDNLLRGFDFDTTRDRFLLLDLLTAVYRFETSGARTSLIDMQAAGAPTRAGSAFVHDRPRDRYLVHDFTSQLDADSIVRIDPDTDTVDVLYREKLGEGPEYGGNVNSAVHFAAESFYLVDFEFGELIQLPPAGNDRIRLSGGGVGTGASLAGALSLFVDAERERAFVGTLDSVIEVDLTTGDRRVLSSPTVGNGPLPGRISGITYVPDADRVIALDENRGGLFNIDPVSGFRSEFSVNGTDDIQFTEAAGLDLSPNGTELLTITRGSPDERPGAVAVSFPDGARTKVSDGIELRAARWLSDTELVLATQSTFLRQLRGQAPPTTPVSGRRFGVPNVGPGTSFMAIDFGLDREREVAYVYALRREAMIAVDLVTGGRFVIAQ